MSEKVASVLADAIFKDCCPHMWNWRGFFKGCVPIIHLAGQEFHIKRISEAQAELWQVLEAFSGIALGEQGTVALSALSSVPLCCRFWSWHWFPYSPNHGFELRLFQRDC